MKCKTLNAQHEECQLHDEESLADIGSLQILRDFKVKALSSSSIKKGLIFISRTVNEKKVQAMSNTKATHDFFVKDVVSDYDSRLLVVEVPSKL